LGHLKYFKKYAPEQELDSTYGEVQATPLALIGVEPAARTGQSTCGGQINASVVHYIAFI
jgi:hypothetical protein